MSEHKKGFIPGPRSNRNTAPSTPLEKLFDDAEKAIFDPKAEWADGVRQVFPKPLSETGGPKETKNPPLRFELPEIEGRAIVGHAGTRSAAATLKIAAEDTVRLAYGQHGIRNGDYYPSQITLEVHKPTPEGKETHMVACFEVVNDTEVGETLGFVDWEERRAFEIEEEPDSDIGETLGSAMLKGLDVTPPAENLGQIAEDLGDSGPDLLLGNSTGEEGLELTPAHVTAIAQIANNYQQLV